MWAWGDPSKKEPKVTHTLHRRGDIESLHEDYVLLFMPAKGINFDESEERMKQIWEVLSHYKENLVNFGNLKDGNSHRIRIEDLKKTSSRIGHAVFKNQDTLKACLKELKERDFGISIVVSGLHENIERICSEIGLSPHTVQYSLGIYGKTELLPDENVLEITTMCGHALVSADLVKEILNRITEGKMSYQEGAKELSRICECGIFNPHRAESLLRRMTSAARENDGE